MPLYAGLYAWRDRVARSEDESTGYVLSRNLMQKLALQLPTTIAKIKSLCNTRCRPPIQLCVLDNNNKNNNNNNHDDDDGNGNDNQKDSSNDDNNSNNNNNRNNSFQPIARYLLGVSYPLLACIV